MVGKEIKKETLLGLHTKREEDFGKWYSQVVTAAELIEYYDISGCYILRPHAYGMWESIQRFLDGEIKKLGVQNSYFPCFVSQKALTAEKDHVEGFAAEVAWVTKSGNSDLEEPIAVRPTSETVMYPIFSSWIRSHRDLPMKLNQWCNVVRWEFSNPTPFIRSREFLWQEGHTAFASKAEADVEVRCILDLYQRVYEELLCVPVIQGVKSEKEKFAGGLYTTTVEAFVPATGRGIQGATSHCLGQNFAKMFQIEFESEQGEKKMVWQNSWGMTTRTIGVMIMVHGDNKGLVLPPRIAPVQLVVIPIPNQKLSEADTLRLKEGAAKMHATLTEAGVRAKLDDRENYTPGWKYNHWELKGVPLRCEYGPRDMENNTCVLVRRDTGEKTPVAIADLFSKAQQLMDKMQKDMLAKATAERNANVATVLEWKDFTPALNEKKMVLTPWCEEPESEDEVKKKSKEESPEGGGAKTLCIPFEQPPLPEGTKCFITGKPAKSWCLWGRSY
mmetsp:Transcript_7663/g.15592  ORF Transcript_7663/g.15592 Transcript_7663/m.15592 type:complete len:502 (-) Transcript_7663:102-1607(-)|eukprot:CAMPEP_0118934632 /NCGR_PEP_ID=MMETSP1169-20130426/13929_1 /TAXON_ID=36882 /ORGANISM="Pyramimonas obovata, Strain CCMP722" /LENGTH=501 /DNA_ID=CAMNT_0006877555 /DNA_START=181 /DNA_END=1686 /DNA_ORIENTATION=-